MYKQTPDLLKSKSHMNKVHNKQRSDFKNDITLQEYDS